MIHKAGRTNCIRPSEGKSQGAAINHVGEFEKFLLPLSTRRPSAPLTQKDRPYENVASHSQLLYASSVRQSVNSCSFPIRFGAWKKWTHSVLPNSFPSKAFIANLWANCNDSIENLSWKCMMDINFPRRMCALRSQTEWHGRVAASCRSFLSRLWIDGVGLGQRDGRSGKAFTYIRDYRADLEISARNWVHYVKGDMTVTVLNQQSRGNWITNCCP